MKTRSQSITRSRTRSGSKSTTKSKSAIIQSKSCKSKLLFRSRSRSRARIRSISPAPVEITIRNSNLIENRISDNNNNNNNSNSIDNNNYSLSVYDLLSTTNEFNSIVTIIPPKIGIGYGSNSIIYRGKLKLNNNLVAIKVENCHSKFRSLVSEQRILLEFYSESFNNPLNVSNVSNFIRWKPCISNIDHSIEVSTLIMPLYYKTLTESININNSSIKLMYMNNYINLYKYIAIQGLIGLNQCANFNIIHRDISKNNFMWKLQSNEINNNDSTSIINNINELINYQLILIDFGCSIKFNLNTNNNNIKSKTTVGTRAYRSIRCDNKYSNSYSDDLESFGYILYDIGYGELPWMNENLSDLEIIKIKKEFINNNNSNLPKHLINYFQICLKLKYGEKPDWNLLYKIFNSL